MTSFGLKNYQTATLDALRSYLDAARMVGAKRAYDETDKFGVRNARPYRALDGLPNVPYICLRLPTGGGKTLLSAHTTKIAADAYLEREFPLVLWLVPTNTIRAQTLETLKKPGNPNHETLRDAFDGRFRVFDIADFTQITPADLHSQVCIVVGTMQTLRVSNTDGRKVYAHNENLEPHFAAVPASTAGLERLDDGGIKFSFRNLLALNRPLVIVDEAHNNRSALSVEVLQRVNAACVVEFTATPAADSNVLHNVSATALKAEEMIKLPIRLTEHKSWEDAVQDSILTRQKLHDLAVQDSAYIRPIILFQAEEKGREVTKEILVQHLMDQHAIPRDKIAVVTGDQKELDGINLFARDCKIDFVVTVEALKEGWDCSFAYVFCSVATVHSPKDVEQILGRVLRMPYAKRRKDPDLNRAYAHVARASWPNAVRQLHDRLVDMGFEDDEADSAIEQVQLDLPGGAGLFASGPAPTIFQLSEDISALPLSPEEQASVRIEKTETGSRVILTGDVPETVIARLAAAMVSPAARSDLHTEAKRHRTLWRAATAPAQRGVAFLVPQLCFSFDDVLLVADDAALLEAIDWNLLDYKVEISESEFRLTETGVQWELDLNLAGKITERTVGMADQFDLDLVDTGWTVTQLCQWLEGKLRKPEFPQMVWLEYIRRALAYLTDTRKVALPVLVRWKFILAKVLAQKISYARDTAGKASYQRLLFGPDAAVEASFSFAFDFSPGGYAPRWAYVGHPYQFQKHYYPVIGELKNTGEEYECAKVLDMTPQVKHWVRNLERRGFWLPLAKGRFYPDFVAELVDGRILVVEYKGADRVSADDARAKSEVGALWEKASGGRAVFVMPVEEKGRLSLFEQIAGKIK